MPLSYEQKTELVSDLNTLRDEHILDRVETFFVNAGIPVDEEINVLEFADVLLVVLFRILYGEPFDVRGEDVANSYGHHMFKYTSTLTTRLTAHDRHDICWVYRHLTQWLQGGKNKHEPSPKLYKLLKKELENGSAVHTHPPIYIRRTSHYGRECGLGAFSLVRMLPGQLIYQFIGRVHANVNNFFSAGVKQMRSSYAMEASYRGRKFIINPFDASSKGPDPNCPTAFINEPSAPPVGMIALHIPTGRNVLTLAYRHMQGDTEVEFADNVIRYVPSDELRVKDGEDYLDDKHTANCMWQDFPVPLEFYEFSYMRHDELYVYRKRSLSKSTCEVVYTHAEAMTLFESFGTDSHLQKLTKASFRLLSRSDVLVLKPKPFDGLYRESIVTKIDKRHVHVKHFVTDATWWRLPREALASKLNTCSECRRKDDGRCTACTFVAFPVIHACKDIYPGQELLCLYREETEETRGVACGASGVYLPPWCDWCQPKVKYQVVPPTTKPQPSWLPDNYRIV